MGSSYAAKVALNSRPPAGFFDYGLERCSFCLRLYEARKHQFNTKWREAGFHQRWSSVFTVTMRLLLAWATFQCVLE